MEGLFAPYIALLASYRGLKKLSDLSIGVDSSCSEVSYKLIRRDN